MLSTGEFTGGSLSDAQALALMLPRSRYEEPILVGGDANKRCAVFLGDRHRFQCFQYDRNDNWTGLIVKDVTVEVDEGTAFDPDVEGARLGSIVRQDTRLCICATEERNLYELGMGPGVRLGGAAGAIDNVSLGGVIGGKGTHREHRRLRNRAATSAPPWQGVVRLGEMKRGFSGWATGHQEPYGLPQGGVGVILRTTRFHAHHPSPWATTSQHFEHGIGPNYGPNYSSELKRRSMFFLIFQRLDGESGWDRTNDHLIKS